MRSCALRCSSFTFRTHTSRAGHAFPRAWGLCSFEREPSTSRYRSRCARRCPSSCYILTSRARGMRSAREDAHRVGIFRFAFAVRAILRSSMLHVTVSYALRAAFAILRADTSLVAPSATRAGYAFRRARVLKVKIPYALRAGHAILRARLIKFPALFTLCEPGVRPFARRCLLNKPLTRCSRGACDHASVGAQLLGIT